MNLILPWWVRPLAILLVAVSLYTLGRFHQMQADEAARNEAIIDSWEQGDQHVANYIRRSRELADPVTVGSRLDRVCHDQLRGARGAARAATADAADRRTDIERLAGELIVVQQNRYQCEALIGTVTPQLYNKPGWWEVWRK